ncbi:unnamed protein product [Amoebophrya sp. A25]|nr:unnamed protein product [Amoebophrya sp. A25]|eukprot:GSA25T00016178001.1
MALNTLEKAASAGCLADIEQAMKSGSKLSAALRKCIDPASTGKPPAHETRNSRRILAQNGHHLYRMGDTSLPIEVIIERPRFGGPARHITVHGDANVGEIKFPANPKVNQMSEGSNFEGFPAYDQDKTPAALKNLYQKFPRSSNAMAGLLGAYYMGWNEYGYTFDGENAKRMFPTTSDVSVAPGKEDARRAAGIFSAPMRDPDRVKLEQEEESNMKNDAVLVRNGVYFPWKRGLTAERASMHAIKEATRMGKNAGVWRSQLGVGRNNFLNRFIPQEDTPLSFRNPAAMGTSEGDQNELWGSIADNALRMAKFYDYFQLPFVYQGPRKKQHVAPIRITVAVEGPFSSWDDLPTFAIKLLPPPSGKLNAMAARIVSPDVETRIVPEGSFL